MEKNLNPSEDLGGAARLGTQEHPLLGYYDSAEQTEPTFNPGLNVPCVICYKPLCAPMKTMSLMKPGGSRSYFYRAHKACYEGLAEQEVADLEWSMLNPKTPKASPEGGSHLTEVPHA